MKRFRLLGGEGVRRSLSPRMHNRVLAACGLAGSYRAQPVPAGGVGRAVARLAAAGAAGANVTAPHKRAVVPHLASLAPEAAALGAVNTLVPAPGGFRGHNTDAAGFADALARAGFDPAGARALVIGAGGAARAVAWSLLRGGAARVALAARDPERARRAAAGLGCRGAGLGRAAEWARRAELVVNAASVSTAAESPEMARLAASLRPERCRLVMDLNYGRGGGVWQELARQSGAAFGDGLVMLAAQARRSFALWTGLRPELELFLAALEERPCP
jgi:shikimate dehydrogenase